MHITAAYQLSPAEARRGLSRINRRQRRSGALAGTFALLSALNFAEHIAALGVFCIFACAFYGFLSLFSSRMAVRKNASRLCGMRTVTFTEEFLAAETDLSKSKVKWAALFKAEETPEFFLLYVTKRSAVILPKRAFTVEQNAELGVFLAKQTFGQ